MPHREGEHRYKSRNGGEAVKHNLYLFKAFVTNVCTHTARFVLFAYLHLSSVWGRMMISKGNGYQGKLEIAVT